MCKCDDAKAIVQTWLDKQGHERCWYYPDLFNQLATLFEIQPSVEPALPSRAEFQEGCRRYQVEQFGELLPSVNVPLKFPVDESIVF